MELNELRARIDSIDEEMIRLFAHRMEISAEIARYKTEHGLPVEDLRREQEKLRRIEELAPAELRDYAGALYSKLFALSRNYQEWVRERKTEPPCGEAQ